jgi:hypothetical protein
LAACCAALDGFAKNPVFELIGRPPDWKVGPRTPLPGRDEGIIRDIKLFLYDTKTNIFKYFRSKTTLPGLSECNVDVGTALPVPATSNAERGVLGSGGLDTSIKSWDCAVIREYSIGRTRRRNAMHQIVFLYNTLTKYLYIVTQYTQNDSCKIKNTEK